MSREIGGAAFPSSGFGQFAPEGGMSLRDYFAAKALAGFAANPSLIDSNDSKAIAYMADCAYQVADAMLLARSE